MELRPIRSFSLDRRDSALRSIAEMIHLNQLALSLPIRGLEDEIGIRLCQRNRAGGLD